jgi:hypothetical protein
MMVSLLIFAPPHGRRIDRNQYALGDNYSRVEALEMHIKERAIIDGPPVRKAQWAHRPASPHDPGVCYDPSIIARLPWCVTIMEDGANLYLGFFGSEPQNLPLLRPDCAGPPKAMKPD